VDESPFPSKYSIATLGTGNAFTTAGKQATPRYLSRAQGKKSETRYKIGDFGRACRCSLFLCLQLALIVRRKRLGQDWPAAGVVRGSEAIDDGRPSATLVAQAFENLPEPGPSQI
jgi:hypothetical protein